MAPSTFTWWLRLFLVLIGLPSFGLGVLAVFTTDNGTGTGVLIAFGGIVLVVAVLGGRIDTLEFGGAKLRLRAAAAEKYAQALESESRGDLETAEVLREEAAALLDAAGPIAANYLSVRRSMRAGPERTARLEAIVSDARRLAGEQTFQPAEVSRLLRDGDAGERITALGIMQAEPALRDFDAVLAAITRSRSPFEQYEALDLADRMVGDLDARQRRRLAEGIRSQRGLRFRSDASRWNLSERILNRLEP